MKTAKFTVTNLILLIAFMLPYGNATADDNKPFTWQDAMKFKALRSAAISFDGTWAAWENVPDRGDKEAVFQHTEIDTLNYLLERGDSPQISSDNLWGACFIIPKAIEAENAKSQSELPKKKLNLVNLKNGNISEYEKVNKFEFSNDANWLAFMHYDDESIKKEGDIKKKPIGSKLVLKHLETGTDIDIDFVNEFELDSASNYVIYSVSSPDGKKDGIYYRDLTQNFIPEKKIEAKENNYFGNISFNTKVDKVAFITSGLDKEGEPQDGEIKVYDISGGLKQNLTDTTNFPSFLYIPYKNNKLEWTLDNDRLFFGYKFTSEKDTTDKDDIKFTDSTFYSLDSIRMKKDLKMWHWDDPRIAPHQEKWWQQNKDRTYSAVYDFERANYTLLGDSVITSVAMSENGQYTIGYDDTKYQKEIMYNGWFYDLYLINMITGQETLLDTRLEEPAHISPGGEYVIYFKDDFWYIYFTESEERQLLTEQIENINFYDETWDRPADPPSYGFGGFVKGDRDGFLIYDRYDIWQFDVKTDTKTANAFNLTDAIGRENEITFRPIRLDRERKYYSSNDTLLISAFHNDKKWRGIYEMQISVIGPLQKIKEEGYTYNAIRQSRNKEKVLITKQNFSVYPDIWISNMEIDTLIQVSHLGKQTDEFLWGYTEVIDWQSERGDSLQGYLIKPDNYDPDKKYPLIVFFYEQMSDRAFTFWQPRIFHLISYPNYFPDDYIFLLPDIKYYEGNPGFDALDAINSGCQYLIDEGIADPDKIGLQGHSWSAYQAAFMITKTDMYSAAVIGAPVGNMTSAYSGIRTGTGLARQFQYEKYQSRIGGNLWDSLDNYLNNSPVFTAPDADTPMLIYHGTVDEAVPFSQGVELFLAFRRLEKEVILLEYTGEPHHPRKYENKLDYAIRMKEFYDHYLLGKPAPEWIIKGKLYRGK